MKKENIFKIVGLIIIILVITIISSYAYFTAGVTGGETNTTLSVSGGTMNITYSSGSKITLTNVYPQEEALTTKTFSLTGNNTTKADMPYNISLAVKSNTFLQNSLKFSLTGTNPGDNGALAPNITMQGIPNGTSEITLGNGIFNGPTNGEIHTYLLSIFFPNTTTPQNEDQGKSFNAYIKVDTSSKHQIDYILLANGGAEAIGNKEAPDFNEVSPSFDSITGYEFIDEEVSEIIGLEFGGFLYTQKPSFSEEYGGWELNFIFDEDESAVDPSTGEFYTEGLEIIDDSYTFTIADIGKYYLSIGFFINNAIFDASFSYFFESFSKINEVENGIVTSVTLSKPKPIYDGTGQGLYKMEDDYGDSYYFRGAKDYVNNNLIFAEHQWKIIRINGDGSLRIIYNGTCPGNSCTINSTGTGTHMMLPSENSLYNSSGNTAYNSNCDDAKYV